MLEQHHKKLGQLLKTRHENPPVEQQTGLSSDKSQNAPANAPANATSAVTSAKDSPTYTPGAEAVPKPPRLPRTSRVPGRDLSSSIASNLATARGIPGSQQRRGGLVSPSVSAQHAGGRFANEQAVSKHGTETVRTPGNSEQDTLSSNEVHRNPSWTPPAIIPAQNVQAQEEATKSTSDTPFQQFYNTFESLVSKLSAPLAFAGLPLNTTTTPPAANPAPKNPAATPGTKSKNTKSPATAIPLTAESLDYSQLISQAALRAVRDGVPSSNPAESFYVVPTEGGMASYSEIIQRTARDVSNRHHRQLSNISEDNDDFVDARETFPTPVTADSSAPGTAAHSRRGSARPGFGGKVSDLPKVAGKTMEELALENQMLRQYLDSTSKRLRVFELSAQSSSAALAQSIRSLQRSPSVTPENSRGRADESSGGRGVKVDEKARIRIAELEEILRKNDKELQRREKENAKLKDVVVRYREKWEKLKEGARARREGGGNGGGDRTPKIVEDGIGD